MNDYEIETAEYIKHNYKLFQCSFFGASDIAHAQKYIDYFNPKGVVVDMGCGIGEMGALLQALDSEITDVINVTNCKAQTEYMREAGRKCILSDYHHVAELPDGAADFVMFNESLGYGDITELMRESARLLKVEGRIAVKDFSGTVDPLNIVPIHGWDYLVWPMHRVLAEAANAGLCCELIAHPPVSIDRWMAFARNSRVGEWHGDHRPDVRTTVYIFRKLPTHVQH